MQILRCVVNGFRGFEQAEVVPRGHVLLVAELRAGRSHSLAALTKVFEVDASRVDEFVMAVYGWINEVPDREGTEWPRSP